MLVKLIIEDKKGEIIEIHFLNVKKSFREIKGYLCDLGHKSVIMLANNRFKNTYLDFTYYPHKIKNLDHELHICDAINSIKNDFKKIKIVNNVLA